MRENNTNKRKLKLIIENACYECPYCVSEDNWWTAKCNKTGYSLHYPKVEISVNCPLPVDICDEN